VDRREQLSRLADEELMVLVAGADPEAYELIFDRHVSAAYSLAYRICGEAASADDATQDAMLGVWRSATSYRAHLGSVRSWILTIAHHRAIDLVRRRTRRDDRLLHDDTAAERLPATEDVEALALERELRGEVRELLDALPEEQRRVVELAFYAGFSQSEIAELLGLPLGTVKSRTRLGLIRLKRALEGTPANA